LSPFDDRSADDSAVAALMRLREALAGFDAVVRQRGDASPADPGPMARGARGPDGEASQPAGESPPARAGGPASFAGAEHNARLPATAPCEIPDV
jgi:hypothetical protein